MAEKKKVSSLPAALRSTSYMMVSVCNVSLLFLSYYYPLEESGAAILCNSVESNRLSNPL